MLTHAQPNLVFHLELVTSNHCIIKQPSDCLNHIVYSMLFTIPVVIAIIIAMVACLFLLQPQTLSKISLEDKVMRNGFKSSKHKWEKSEQNSFYFCYLCNRLTNGWFSDILECKKCGIIIHKFCRYTKLRKPDCKYLVAKTSSSRFYHQWRQTTHITNSNCSVCDQVCNGIESYICIWCGRMRHALCSGQGSECDFGPLRKFVLEPNEIKCNSVNFTTNAFKTLSKIRKSVREKTSGSEQEESEDDRQISISCGCDKRIAVVLINKKSGGQVGNQFIKAFYRVLNPLQVISILDEGLERLKLFAEIPNVFLMIAGGDGTICSVMNYVKTIPQWKDHNPPFAVIPLGTGNDLSRSLGWGGSIEDVNATDLLQECQALGRQQMLDRWKLKIISDEVEREFTVYNYIGIGLDAKICRDFHQLRQKYPQLFFSQLSNKLIYTQLGTGNLFKGDEKDLQLSSFLKMNVDGKEVSIADYENIIFLNIEHWGGGVTDLWRQGEQWAKSSGSDGLLEVIGLTDVLHMGQVQVGMDEPNQVAQGKRFEIKSNAPRRIVPIQLDGEPVELITPFSLVIERKDQIDVLATTPTDSGKVVTLLKKGLKEGVISQEQYSGLVELSRKEQ